MAVETADIYAEEAKTKFAKEFSLVETVAKHLVLQDAEVKVEAAGIDGIGFGKQPGAVIKFSVPAQLEQQQEDNYRTSAQEHAPKFAQLFNAQLARLTAQPGPDGKMIPVMDRDVARAKGTEIHIDLGLLRNMLSHSTVADVLPKISEHYSSNYMIEKFAAKAPVIVQRTIMQREAAEQDAKLEDKILSAVEKVVENPAYIGELLQSDPKLIPPVQQNVRNFAGIAAQAANNPELLESLRENQPRIAGIVEKIMEQQKERPVASPVAEPETAEKGEQAEEKPAKQEVAEEKAAERFADKAPQPQQSHASAQLTRREARANAGKGAALG